MRLRRQNENQCVDRTHDDRMKTLDVPTELIGCTEWEGTGTRPDYLMKRDDKKIGGHSGKNNSQKSRNSCLANGGGVGAHRHLTRGSNGLSPGTKYKRSKNVFAVTSIARTVVCPCTELSQLPAYSLIGSPGTLPIGIIPVESYDSTKYQGVPLKKWY